MLPGRPKERQRYASHPLHALCYIYHSIGPTRGQACMPWLSRSQGRMLALRVFDLLKDSRQGAVKRSHIYKQKLNFAIIFVKMSISYTYMPPAVKGISRYVCCSIHPYTYKPFQSRKVLSLKWRVKKTFYLCEARGSIGVWELWVYRQIYTLLKMGCYSSTTMCQYWDNC